MNLIPLAALLLSCLAVAISVSCAVAVMRLQARTPHHSPVPRRRGPLMQDAARRRQVQLGGDGSIQVQTGGSLTIDETSEHRAERVAREVLKQQGRHL